MIKKNPLVSILIINYNNTNFLERSINSCLNQSYKNIEILVYDDKSTETIIKIEKKFKKTKTVKFYKNRNTKINIPALDASNSYRSLFNKSKGQIICLLDSDDFFRTSKVKKIIKIFTLDKKISFIQNLNTNDINVKNSTISFWPYFAPESCISFKRSFFIKFQKDTDKLKFKFTKVWLGFRLAVYSYYKDKSFYHLNEKLTFYENFGQSIKYKKFNNLWWQRRKDSFMYTHIITKKLIFLVNFDYLISSRFFSFRILAMPLNLCYLPYQAYSDPNLDLRPKFQIEF